MITKFRTCNHKLSVEKGRYNNVERYMRYCDICNQDMLGDEYHLLLECKNTDIKRFRKCTINDYINNTNMYDFGRIMSSISSNSKLTFAVSKILSLTSKSFSCM